MSRKVEGVELFCERRNGAGLSLFSDGVISESKGLGEDCLVFLVLEPEDIRARQARDTLE